MTKFEWRMANYGDLFAFAFAIRHSGFVIFPPLSTC